MTSLVELQNAFAEAVFAPANDQHPIVQQIDSQHGPAAAERLNIYRDSILSSFSRVLASTYPVIETLLGEDFFAAMARHYASLSPSLQPDLGEFGRQFAEFLTEFEPVKEFVYLPDVARLEWLWEEVFYAADDADANFAALVTLSNEALQKVRFTLSASARLLQSPYPVLSIWQANQSDEEGTEINLDNGGDQLLLLRQGDECRMDRLTPAEWSLLNALHSGHSFAQLIELAGGLETLNKTLPLYVQRGWIVGLNLNHI
ncbi:MAG: DNA-binding domain-containing protein [Gammaproteobacteria bacterium]|nr:DNA-binding domain-containing protein [Gammaproteobacteria bacterium]